MQARRSYKRSTRTIKAMEEDLASEFQREPDADWYRSYIRGKIASCVKARTSHAEKPHTVAKAIRSILRKKIVTRSDVRYELDAAAEQITHREEADRVIKLAYHLKLSILILKREPATLLNEAAEALRMKLKRMDIARLLPFRYR